MIVPTFQTSGALKDKNFGTVECFPAAATSSMAVGESN